MSGVFGRVCRHWIEGLAAGLAVACIAALLARVSWVAELFTHFRLQYAVLGTGTLLALIWRRSWLAALALAPLLAAVTWPLLAYFSPPAAVRAATGAELTIMSANLSAGNRRTTALLALVRAEMPDVIVLTELTHRWVAALEPLLEAYPHQLLEPRRRGGEGIGVLSRLPVSAARIVPLESMPAAALTLEVAGRDVQLLGIHLRSPPVPRAMAERNRQLVALAERVRESDGPRIVTGDFNSTPFSPWLADWIDATGLDDAARGRGYLYTWPTFLPILGIPIDHCFVSEDFHVLELRRLPAFGSDHYPILARLALRAK